LQRAAGVNGEDGPVRLSFKIRNFRMRLKLSSKFTGILQGREFHRVVEDAITGLSGQGALAVRQQLGETGVIFRQNAEDVRGSFQALHTHLLLFLWRWWRGGHRPHLYAALLDLHGQLAGEFVIGIGIQ
jgi:hypothetical protein